MIREYRVKPVTRFIVTEFAQDTSAEGTVTQTRQLGEWPNQQQAEEVAHALAAANAGYVQAAEAPAVNETQAIFAGLPTYLDEHGDVRSTPPSPLE